MRIEISPRKDKPGFFSVVPHGPIDSDTYQEFSNNINPFLNSSTRGIVIDLQDVDYISSAGLGAIFTLKKFLKSNNGDLLFCNIKPQIRKLFEIVKALPDATLFENIAEADHYFYKIMNETIEKEKEKKARGV